MRLFFFCLPYVFSKFLVVSCGCVLSEPGFCCRMRHLLALKPFFPTLSVLVRLFYGGCGLYMPRCAYKKRTRVLFHTTKQVCNWWNIPTRCRVHHFPTVVSTFTQWFTTLSLLRPSTYAYTRPLYARLDPTSLPHAASLEHLHSCRGRQRAGER